MAEFEEERVSQEDAALVEDAAMHMEALEEEFVDETNVNMEAAPEEGMEAAEEEAQAAQQEHAGIGP